MLQTITKTGSYFVSKLRSSGCRRFGSEVRASLPARGTFIATPGPGTYRAPSEFGYYEAQKKYKDEQQRIEAVKGFKGPGTAYPKGSRNVPTGGVSQKAATVSVMTRSSSQPALKSSTATANSPKK